MAVNHPVTNPAASSADGQALAHLRSADAVLAGVIDAHADFDPRSYQLDHLPSQQEVLQIAEPWRPYRSLATAYLFQVALDAPGAPSPASSDTSSSGNIAERHQVRHSG